MELSGNYLPYRYGIGLVFSVAGMVLSPFSSFFARTYSNSLDTAQLLWLLAVTYSPDIILFSNHLYFTWFRFVPSFLPCPHPDFVCQYGGLLSFFGCWIALLIIAFIIFKCIQRKKPDARFKGFYKFYKGIFRWTFAPLVYYSVQTLIKYFDGQGGFNQLLSSGGTLGLLVLWIFFELVGWRCIQKKKHNKWIKWLQLLNHLKIASLVSLVVIQEQMSENVKYALYGPIVLYQLLFLFKYPFVYKVVERLFHAFETLAVITIYTIFITDHDVIERPNVDFLAMLFIITLQTIRVCLRMYSYCKGKDGTVAPEQQQPEEESVHQEQIPPESKNTRQVEQPQVSSQGERNLLKGSIKKKPQRFNSFEVTINDTSIDNLQQTSSPRRRRG